MEKRFEENQATGKNDRSFSTEECYCTYLSKPDRYESRLLKLISVPESF